MAQEHTYYMRTGRDGMDTATVGIVGTDPFPRGHHRLVIFEHTHGHETERMLTDTGWVERPVNTVVEGDYGIDVSSAVLAALNEARGEDRAKIKELEAEVERWKQLADASARALEAVSGVMAPTRTVYPDGH